MMENMLPVLVHVAVHTDFVEVVPRLRRTVVAQFRSALAGDVQMHPVEAHEIVDGLYRRVGQIVRKSSLIFFRRHFTYSLSCLAAAIPRKGDSCSGGACGAWACGCPYCCSRRLACLGRRPGAGVRNFVVGVSSRQVTKDDKKYSVVPHIFS